MKNTSKKLIVAASALVIAATATVGSTFAWLNIGGTVSANNMNIQLTTGDGLYIRKHVKASVDTDTSIFDPKEIEFDAVSDTIKPVSTVDGTNWYELSSVVAKDSSNSDSNEGKFAYASVSDKTGYWVDYSFDLLISNGYDVKISELSVTSSSTYMMQASRLWIYARNIDETAFDTGKGVAEVGGYRLVANTATKDYALAQTNKVNKYQVSDITGKCGDTFSSTDDAATYWNPGSGTILSGTSTSIKVGDANAVTSETTATTFTTSNVDPTYKTDEEGGAFYGVNFIFRLYVEGNDYYCHNSLFGTTLGFSATFATVAATATE